MNRFFTTTPPGARLSNVYSYGVYLSLIKSALKRANCSLHWTPHSARAGWASTKRLEGWTFGEVKEAGRWTSDASLRIYLDQAVVAVQELTFPEMKRVSEWILGDFERRFPWW